MSAPGTGQPNPTEEPKKTFMENVMEKLKDPVVWGGLLAIVILIVVAVVMMTKKHKVGGGFTETATKYLLSNTPDLMEFGGSL